MDCEKLYKEALERAKKLKAGFEGYNANVAIIEEIFPELRESEDERIRKRIRLCLDECVHSDIIRDYERDECLAYLERHKEQNSAEMRDSRKVALMIGNGRRSGVIEGRKQVLDNPEEYGLCKPVEWSEEDKKTLDEVIEHVRNYQQIVNPANETGESNLTMWLESLPERLNLPPKQEWSEYDKAAINNIVLWLSGSFISDGARRDCLKWFDEHRRDFLNLPHWKPSEEQILAIVEALKYIPNNKEEWIILENLMDDLKKL